MKAAEDLAWTARHALASGIGRLDMTLFARAGLFIIGEAKLHPGRGGKEAMMFANSDGRFHISVDSTPAEGWFGFEDSLRREVARQRLRFRVGHEIGHSFFYRRDGDRRVRTRRATAAEERFCDYFSSCLLVPPPAVRPVAPVAASVIELHRRFDVSLEVAARALAEAHPEATLSVWFWQDDRNLELQWAPRSDKSTEAVRRLRPVVAATPLAQLADRITGLGRRWTASLATPPRRQLVVVSG